MRRITPSEAHLFLDTHKQAKNHVDEALLNAIGRAEGELYRFRLEDEDSFLSLVWYQGAGVRLLAPDGAPRTLRDVAKRFIQRGFTFDALAGNLGFGGDEHEPGFFEKCLPIDSCFNFGRFGWVAVVDANADERAQAPLGRFYIYDGLHRTLVLAKRLLTGEATYRPVEALYLTPRP
jgi:hypothetical protein